MNRLTSILIYAAVIVATLGCKYANADTATRLNEEIVFIPLGEKCQQYYSLNEPGKVCRDGNLYFRAYDITYAVNGNIRSVRLVYIPERSFEVNAQGEVKPRNLAFKNEHDR